MTRKNETEFPEINKLIHEPARLNLISILFVIESADFLFLMRQSGLTKGNLSSHLSKLESAGILEIEKTFVDKIPRTLIKLTDAGREEFIQYKKHMMEFLLDLPKR